MVKKAEKEKIRTLIGDSNNKGKGFTFVELMFVLLILGFMLLLTFPNFRDVIGPKDMKRAVLGLVGSLRYAQSQAATTKNTYRLNMEVKNNTYWISSEGEPEGPSNSLAGDIIFWDVYHPERGKVQEGSAYVEFSPTGWAEECTIHLKRNEEVFTIFVHPLGGKVEVVEGYLERLKG
jgi:prepilin-type N-terminal cleavage/methylation domain-containing protein